MTDAVKYNKAILDVYTGKHDFDSNEFSFRLTNTAPDKAVANNNLASLSEIAHGNGYSAIPVDLTASQSNGVLSITHDIVGNEFVIEATNGPIPTFQYCALYNETSDLLICYSDRGAPLSLNKAGDKAIIKLPTEIVIGS